MFVDEDHRTVALLAGAAEQTAYLEHLGQKAYRTITLAIGFLLYDSFDDDVALIIGEFKRHTTSEDEGKPGTLISLQHKLSKELRGTESDMFLSALRKMSCGWISIGSWTLETLNSIHRLAIVDIDPLHSGYDLTEVRLADSKLSLSEAMVTSGFQSRHMMRMEFTLHIAG
ncbi:hypothetical protein CDD80_3456 [Ophiocordyceps camponoti-rufipedis]|uniref:Uncharacterized protein n=1 Tax=Ophiocordyceps camponoti-rufipedis TaxID=2004952 RepID=A0A2C5Z447_9HYPO|nr:hypothetical protein CDD80_3456 [Ophiocordyceps camponoti-rufipedis]